MSPAELEQKAHKLFLDHAIRVTNVEPEGFDK